MLSIQDFDLPKSAVSKIVKSHLPAGTHLSADAKMVATRCATVWINYITNAALESAPGKDKKRITSDSIIKALDVVEMGETVGSRVEEHLNGPFYSFF
jgi:histone H3/H4